MNIEICIVDTDAATYYEHALRAADAIPGGAWKSYGRQCSLPVGSTVVRTHKISLAYGLPNWAYCFWREVD